MVVVLLVLLTVRVTDARKETLTLTKDDRRWFHIESFGYEANGRFEMTVRDFELWVPSNSDYAGATSFKIKFALQRSETDTTVHEDTHQCLHETKPFTDDENTVLFDVPPRTKWKTDSEPTAGEDTTETYSYTVERAGYYHLYFSNCEPKTQISMKLGLVQYNQDSSGHRTYLSAGESSLPLWYFLICGMFAGAFIAWVTVLHRRRADVKNIHYLMAVVLALKVATLCFEAFEFHYLKTEGDAHGWNVIYYVFTFVKSSMLFTVIVLIGTGWSYMKPFLTERDKQIVLAVLVVQMMVNVAMVVISETSPGDRKWDNWRDVLHLLDMLCCCAILLPIVWSIRHLREASSADGKAARNVEKLQRFRKFYLLVVSYIYFTRIIVFLLESTLPFELTWLGNVFNELAALVFYVVTGYLFCPAPHNPYLELEQVDLDEDDAVLSAENGGGR